jgi:hypothetical protein
MEKVLRNKSKEKAIKKAKKTLEKKKAEEG